MSCAGANGLGHGAVADSTTTCSGQICALLSALCSLLSSLFSLPSALLPHVQAVCRFGPESRSHHMYA